MYSYCTSVFAFEDFPPLTLSGGRGPGKSSKDDTITRTAKAKAKKLFKLEALRLEAERERKEKEDVMERKKKEKDLRVKRREQMKLKAVAEKMAKRKAMDEKKSALEKMKLEKAEKKKETMEKKLAEKKRKVEMGRRKRKSVDDKEDMAEKVEVKKVDQGLKKKKKQTDGSGGCDRNSEKNRCRVVREETAVTPESEERMVFENYSSDLPEACLPRDGPDGLDVQPKHVRFSRDNTPRPVRVATRRLLKTPEGTHTSEVVKPRTTRFCRRVAVMHVERLERSGTKLKRKLQAGQMFGDEEYVALKKPGKTTGLARRVTQAKINELLGPVRESLEVPVRVASSGCSVTCTEEGCSENCQCRVNGIECFGEAGCLCSKDNCTNDRREDIYDNDVHKELVRRANADLSILCENSDETILSVDPESPVRVVASHSGKDEHSKSPNLVSPMPRTPMPSPSNPVQGVTAAVPQRTQVASGIDLSAEKCSASLSAFMPFILDVNNFRTVQNSSKIKLLTGEAVFFGLIKEATRANALGGCISVMHPDSYFNWRSGHRLDRNQLMESVWYREEVETLLIPLHTGTVQNGHWSLAALFVREGKITVYDSLVTTKDQQKERLGWLKEMMEVMFPRAEFSEIRMRYAYPHQRDTQTDNINCGMHAIINARKIVDGRRNLASKHGEKLNVREERTNLHKSLLAASREYANVAHDPNRRVLTPNFNAPPVALNKNKRR